MTRFHSPPRVLCIGEAMLEISLSDFPNAELSFAGDTLNTAVYLKRLCANSATVSYCTVVGSDALSDQLLSFIDSEQIDTAPVTRAPDRTIGLYAISTDKNGERSFTYWRNQSAARDLFQKANGTDFSLLRQYDLIYLSAITLAILPVDVRQQLLSEISHLRIHQNTLFSFDSNYRPALWESRSVAQSTIEAFWRITDIALPSVDDEQLLFNDANEAAVLNRFNSYGKPQGALKRGAAGPLSLRGDDNTSVGDTSSVDIVDTTAAGDSFNAGFLSAVLHGYSDLEALRQGHQCALRVISQRGAIIPQAIWQAGFVAKST